MEEQDLCMHCSEAITDPVCISCYLKQINYWLTDLGIFCTQKRVIIEKIKKQEFNEGLNEAKCIVCGKENLSVCSYCFFYKVVRILRKIDFNKEALENFLDIFDYRVWNEDYVL